MSEQQGQGAMSGQQVQAISGQQMQALGKHYADALTAIKRDIELRKWAVDQACGMSGAQIEAEAPVIMHPVQLAREIHAFLVEGAKAEGANEQK